MTPWRGLPLLLLAACAGSGLRQVQRGEELLRAGEARPALEAFADAQRDPKVRGLDLTRAQVGEARAFLALGDLHNARNRLRRLEDTVSAKHYHLAEIALAEGDRTAAAACFRTASERGHGGDTTARWAWVVAAEATHPDQVAEAVGILQRGGESGRAKALSEFLAVWVELLTGQPPAPLLDRLEAVQAALADHASVQVLRARLLDRLGRSIEADQAWDLTQATPRPSPAFLAHAAGLRTRLAAEAGDARSLGKALAEADPVTAARLRRELARRRRSNGDLRGALALHRQTVERGGPPAALAAAQAAELEEALGLGEDAAKRPLLVTPEGGAELAALQAGRRARGGDLLGAAALLPAGEGELGRAALLLQAALQALAAERPGVAARLARAARLLVPGDPAALAVESASAERAAAGRAALLRGAVGDSQEALEALGAAGLLRAGALGEVVPLLTRPGGRAALLAGVEGALGVALQGGRGDACAAFLQAAQAALGSDPELLARLRASAALARIPAPALAAPRGLAALGRTAAIGALGPPGGPRLPLGGLARAERGWSLSLPDGTLLPLQDDAGLASALGAPLTSLEWWPLHEDGAEELEAAGHALRAPPWPAAPIAVLE